MRIKSNEPTATDIRRQIGRKPPPGAKMDEPATPTITGTYVPIPEKYRSPDESGLKYTVKTGSQTYDIDLSAPGS